MSSININRSPDCLSTNSQFIVILVAACIIYIIYVIITNNTNINSEQPFLVDGDYQENYSVIRYADGKQYNCSSCYGKTRAQCKDCKNCGYCLDTGKCVPGGSNGPSIGYCDNYEYDSPVLIDGIYHPTWYTYGHGYGWDGYGYRRYYDNNNRRWVYWDNNKRNNYGVTNRNRSYSGNRNYSGNRSYGGARGVSGGRSSSRASSRGRSGRR